MSLLLRRMVEKSISELESFILNVPLYSTLRLDSKRGSEDSAISELHTDRSDGAKYLTDRTFLYGDDEFSLHRPEFMWA